MIFEIINPSDTYTLAAEDPRVAMAVVLILGKGNYGLEDEKRNSYDVVLVYMDKGDVEGHIHSLFDGKGLDDFIRDNIDAVIECFDSVIPLGFSNRFLYDKAIRFMDEKDRLEFRKEVHDRFTSSMNDIGGAAWYSAEWYRKRKERNQ